jgi:hypothetical protein
MGGDDEKEGGGGLSVSEALKLKYQLLRQKNLAKQQELQNKAAGDDSGSSSAAQTTGGASSFSAGQDRWSGGTGSAAAAGSDKGRKRAVEEPGTVSANALDPSVIAAVQASTSAARQKASAPPSSQERPLKKPKMASKLPTVPKRVSLPGADVTESKPGLGGQTFGSDETPTKAAHEDADSSMTRDTGSSFSSRRHSRSYADDSKIAGLLPSVHEALERVLKETCLSRDVIEQKVISALQDMPEQACEVVPYTSLVTVIASPRVCTCNDSSTVIGHLCLLLSQRASDIPKMVSAQFIWQLQGGPKTFDDYGSCMA